MENKHIAKIKVITSRFFWKNNPIYKVSREQLCLCLEKGGMGLTDVEHNAKALFINSLLNQNRKYNSNHYLFAVIGTKNITRETINLIEKARNLTNDSHLDSYMKIYNHLRTDKIVNIRTKEKYPQVDWDMIWENMSKNFITSSAKSTMFEIFNDIVPNQVKMYNHHINNLSNYHCETCKEIDNNLHRIKNALVQK